MPSILPLIFVDDRAEDHVLLQEACRAIGAPFRVTSLTGFDQATAYLSGLGQFADRERHPLPALGLIDYNLAGQTGAELAAWIRSEPGLASLPLVIYSEIDQPAVVSECYEAGADHFLVKPTAFKAIQGILFTLAKGLESDPPSFDMLVTLSGYRPRLPLPPAGPAGLDPGPSPEPPRLPAFD